MVNQADMRSLARLSLFLRELENFRAQLLKEIETLELELQRITHWLGHDALGYWNDEHAKTHRIMLEAERNLSRCTSYVRADERRPCTEEKKRVTRAKERYELCQQKIRIAKEGNLRWEQERIKNRTRVERCRDMTESGLLVAIHQLRGLLERLESYANLKSAATSPSSSPSSNQGSSSASRASPADDAAVNDRPEPIV